MWRKSHSCIHLGSCRPHKSPTDSGEEALFLGGEGGHAADFDGFDAHGDVVMWHDGVAEVIDDEVAEIGSGEDLDAGEVFEGW